MVQMLMSGSNKSLAFWLLVARIKWRRRCLNQTRSLFGDRFKLLYDYVMIGVYAEI